MKNKLIENYEKAVIEITSKFIEKNFQNEDEEPTFEWVGRDIGGVIYINDYFFSFTDILEFTKLKATTKQVFDYGDYSLRCFYDKSLPKYNIKNFLKLKQK